MKPEQVLANLFECLLGRTTAEDKQLRCIEGDRRQGLPQSAATSFSIKGTHLLQLPPPRTSGPRRQTLEAGGVAAPGATRAGRNRIMPDTEHRRRSEKSPHLRGPALHCSDEGPQKRVLRVPESMAPEN